jgi:hypothetical protein
MLSPIAAAIRLGAGAIGLSVLLAGAAVAQERLPWSERSGGQIQPYDERRDSGYERTQTAPYEAWPTAREAYGNRPYGGTPAYAERQRDDAYRPPRNEAYPPGGYAAPGSEPVPYEGERPPYGAERGSPDRYGSERYSSDRYDPRGGYREPAAGYGRPYEPAPAYEQRDAYNAPPPRRYERYDERPGDGTFSMREIRDAGHGFFGSISQGLASVIEYAFKQQGRPNGYILGEDIGGAFVAGLRYGEGTLYTKDAGHHKVYWQGPSIGYDAGAEGSKVMVLVYNLRDPSEIYHRYGGLAPIRSGIGLRLGANIGYLKYTRRPTWNPF